MAMLKGNRRNKVMPQFYRFYSSESIKKSSEAWLNQQGIAVFARFNIMNVEIPNESDVAHVLLCEGGCVWGCMGVGGNPPAPPPNADGGRVHAVVCVTCCMCDGHAWVSCFGHTMHESAGITI